MTPAPELISPRSPRVSAAKRLARRNFRGKERLFLAEGPQAVREAAPTARAAPRPLWSSSPPRTPRTATPTS